MSLREKWTSYHWTLDEYFRLTALRDWLRVFEIEDENDNRSAAKAENEWYRAALPYFTPQEVERFYNAVS